MGWHCCFRLTFFLYLSIFVMEDKRGGERTNITTQENTIAQIVINPILQ
jgi:hypothetical protein